MENDKINLAVVNILGATTARQQYGAWVSQDNETYDVPLGTCVTRWSVRTKQRFFIRQIHQDSITNVVERDGLVLTTTYGGEFAMWSVDYILKWTHVVDRGVAIIHAEWSRDGTTISLSSFNRNRKPPNSQPPREGTVTTWDVTGDIPKLLHRVESCFEAWVAWSADHNLIVFHHVNTWDILYNGTEPKKEIGSEPGKEIRSDPGKEIGSEPIGLEPEKEIGSEPGKEIGSEPIGSEPEKEIGSEPGKEIGSEPRKEIGSEPGKDIRSDPGQEIGSEPIGSEPEKEIGSEPGKEIGSEPRKEIGSEPGKEPGSERTMEFQRKTEVYAMRMTREGKRDIVIRVPGKELSVLTASTCGTRFFICQVDRSITMFNSNLEMLWRHSLTHGNVFGALILRDFFVDQHNTNFSDGVLLGTSIGASIFIPDPLNGNGNHVMPAKCVGEILGPIDTYIIKMHIMNGKRALWFFCQFSVYRLVLAEDHLRNYSSQMIMHQPYGELDCVLGVHDLTCCGMAMDYRGEHVASGDFTGRVCIWKFGNSSHNPSCVYKVDSMVRSLNWRHNNADNEVYFGCMDGTVWKWNYNEANAKIIYNMADTVTCILWMHGKHSTCIAASDTKGFVAVYKEENDEFKKVCFFQAHGIEKPNQVEVWSVAWSPDNAFLATGGEDHTIHIYQYKEDGQDLLQVAKLVGPEAACTCLDWKTTQVGDILAISSDDRTVHCFKKSPYGTSWDLFWKFESIYSHLMITYCALEPAGRKLAAVTMLGHLYVWDLISKKEILSRKLHTGSVEGLQWHHNNLLSSLSSDCTVQVFTFK